MGVDLYTKLKSKLFFKGRETERHLPYSRLFGRLHQNAIYGSYPIIPQFEQKFGMDVSFFFRPNFYDYIVEDWTLAYERDPRIRQIRQSRIRKDRIASENSWVRIDRFRNNLIRFQESLKGQTNYGQELEYDREQWLNYFERGRFESDLKQLNYFLRFSQRAGHQVFTFEVF